MKSSFFDTFSGVQTPPKGRGRYTPLPSLRSGLSKDTETKSKCSVSPWDKPRSLERGQTRVDYYLLKTIFQFVKKKKKKLYLVGGILRDILLNRDKENLDLDFCLKKGAISFGSKLSRKLKAGFVVLDKEHGACRLVKKIDTRIYTLDFSDFRGETIEKDLLHRDFSINALALELEKLFTPHPVKPRSSEQECRGALKVSSSIKKPRVSTRGAGFSPPFHVSEGLKSADLDNLLIDPYGARQDLKLKQIRALNKKGFDEDPLRILRAFSLAAIFGFKIDKPTLKLIKLKIHKLSEVSFERIRDELFKILDRPDSFNYLVMMDKLKILKIIIPEIEKMRGLKQGPYHHLDVWKHTLETVRQLECLNQELKNNKRVQGYLNEVISSERRRRALIKLGALLHDIGKPQALRHEDGKTKFHGHERIGLDITKEVAKRLRLSNNELESLEKMVLWHLRPGYLADIDEITPRATFRYFRDTAQEGVSILLLSIADQRATKGPLTSKKSRIRHEKVVLSLIKECFRRKEKKKLPRLINGDDLINKFKLEPSPLIGKVLAEIEELQAIGKIKTEKQALQEARQLIDKK